MICIFQYVFDVCSSFCNPMIEARSYTFLPYFCALENVIKIQLGFLVILSRPTFTYLCGFVKLNILFSCFYMMNIQYN
ncbi:hypothetical protein KL86DYS2_11280 [uncultured Dysgonomonas sp.]|uniref:Uncharacterized protein n=1 Tax=uncultured Dysgonomonas sp. TaxID=206096 RepID=A0A212JDK8_9BACT|nr:hypothetical protein KL86DYS2_11280 [uncultured Dysgonomonas sp.]